MLWLAGRIDIDRKLLVSAACACAEPALAFVRAGEDRPRLAIEVARAWCVGTATLDDVRAAAAAAYAAYDAAAAAADAAADAAAYAAAHAAYAAAYAAHAANAASYAAYAAARTESLQTSAATVRAMIPIAVIVEALNRSHT